VDTCYTGPCQRQLDTARLFVAGAREAGARYPEATCVDAFDEYPAMELLARWLPSVCAEDPELGELVSAPAAPGNEQRFARAFERIVSKWARGELDVGELESFAGFRDRVRGGLRHIMEREGRSKHIAVITSGGPIAMAMQMALGVSDEAALQLAWVVSNTGVSEFRYRDSRRMTLVRFNTIAHLPDPVLLTYR
jgi:broad specificity phosphatase PhoE